MMSLQDMRASSLEGLQQELVQAKKRLTETTLKFRLQQSTNSVELGTMRRYIAKLKTIMSELSRAQ